MQILLRMFEQNLICLLSNDRINIAALLLSEQAKTCTNLVQWAAFNLHFSVCNCSSHFPIKMQHERPVNTVGTGDIPLYNLLILYIEIPTLSHRQCRLGMSHPHRKSSVSYLVSFHKGPSYTLPDSYRIIVVVMPLSFSG